MVQHHVEEHGHAQFMRSEHHSPHVLGRAPWPMRSQELPGIVAPNASELGRGHELDAIEAE